jgi:hypothetical protein
MRPRILRPARVEGRSFRPGEITVAPPRVSSLLCLTGAAYPADLASKKARRHVPVAAGGGSR